MAEMKILNSNVNVDEADFTAVVFHGVSDIYPPNNDIECKYTIKVSVKPSTKDWIGLFKVGWQSLGEHYTYEWSPFIEQTENVDEERKPTANRVIFRAKYLPSDEEFYQFCYVTNLGEVRGASVPFQIKHKTDASEFEFCEVEDDEGMLMIKNRTAILEESLSRVLEENSSLKVSNEKSKNEVEKLNDIVVDLEKRKSELAAQVNHERKQNSTLSKELENVNNNLKAKDEELGSERQRKAELEVEVEKLENDKKEMVVIVEHANKKCEEFAGIVEKEQMQSSEAQKSKEKLVSEKLQYLQKIAENRELTDNLQAELSKRKEENTALKEEKDNLAATIARLQGDLLKQEKDISKLQEELAEMQKKCKSERIQAQEEVANAKAEMKKLHKEFESKENELDHTVQNLMSKVESLEQEKDVLMEENINDATQFETRVQIIMQESLMKDDAIHRLECELEDAKAKYEVERGRNSALEEDYESALRGLEHQLEGEKALNKSLCTQTDNTVTELQDQLEHQLQVNGEQGRVLETKTGELKTVTEELEINKKEVKSLQEKLNLVNAQLSATDSELNALKTEKEMLQTSVSDIKGENEKSSKNSAASMYALQTAHTHLEKKYIEAKKKAEQLFKDKNELKRAIAAFQGSLSSTDMRHEIEEFRAKNEDLRVRLNMGAEAYKVKFIECRRLESQLKRLLKSQPYYESDSTMMGKLHQELTNQKSMTRSAIIGLEQEKLKHNLKIEELKLELSQRNQEIESLSVKKVDEETTQMAGYTQQLEEDLSDRQNRLKEMEEMFNNEKKEKLNLIDEIVNLQGKLRECEQEKASVDEELGNVREVLNHEQEQKDKLGEMARDKIKEQLMESENERALKEDELRNLRELLTHEQDERDKLGEMARDKIRELEEKVVHLTGEVERWKKEVDMHVEAEAKMMGSSDETREQQQQTSPVSQNQTPFQWPWNRNGQHRPTGQNWGPQPWVWVQGSDSEQPPPTNPHFQPSCPPPPPTNSQMLSMQTSNLECPICHILFPPSETLEKIGEHVNNHLDSAENCQ